MTRKYIRIDNEDICCTCNAGTIIECCNKCGDGVCLDEMCCTVFPHYHNELFVICRYCSNAVCRELIVIIDTEN